MACLWVESYNFDPGSTRGQNKRLKGPPLSELRALVLVILIAASAFNAPATSTPALSSENNDRSSSTIGTTSMDVEEPKASDSMGEMRKDPEISYWHLWADGDGVTHQSDCRLTGLTLQEFAPPTPDIWVGKVPANPSNITVLVLPSGWSGGWHRNPKPQWIVPLSGRWYVESMDGKRVEMGPGEWSFGEDQAAQPDAQDRVGHLSGTIGEEPAVLMLVQLTDSPTVGMPCRHK